MAATQWETCSADALLREFFAQDDLSRLAEGAGALLGCPLLVLDDTFHVAAHHLPLGFSDAVFQASVRSGEITYEAGAIISRSPALSAGAADCVKLADSPYRRRFAPLVSAGVRLGYLICVDTDGHLEKIPAQTWNTVEQILSKQLFVEASRQDKPFETAEDILRHLLDGGFPSAPYFRLQISGTYLVDFHPLAFALIDLTVYHSGYLGQRHLKEEVTAIFLDSHSFLYKGNVMLFLHRREDMERFSALAEEFQLKVIVSEKIDDLFALPALYRTAREALSMMTDERFHGGRVYTVAQLRTPLLLKNLEGREDLIAQEVRTLAAHDREKGTQYCETLYYYLICCRSLQKTCEALFAHRNTVLYRIRRMQEEFGIPLDEPLKHADLLLSVSLLLFEEKGPDFFSSLCQALAQRVADTFDDHDGDKQHDQDHAQAVLLLGPLFGLLSTMIVTGKMSFFSDALGHSGFTGIAIGVLCGAVQPIYFAVGLSVLFALLFSFVRSRTSQSADTIIGVFSSTAVALGIFIVTLGGRSFTKFNRYLIGDILSVSPQEIGLLALVLLAVVLLWVFGANRLVLTAVHPQLASSRGVATKRNETLFTVAIAIVVTLAMSWVGLMVINSLLVLPAASSRNLARNLRQYHLLSVLSALVCGLLGLCAAYWLGCSAGATIALLLAVYFAVSFALRNRAA